MSKAPRENDATPKRKYTTARRPKRRTESLTLMCCPAYREWVDRFSVHTRLETANLLDLALAAYATEQGFEDPPKR